MKQNFLDLFYVFLHFNIFFNTKFMLFSLLRISFLAVQFSHFATVEKSIVNSLPTVTSYVWSITTAVMTHIAMKSGNLRGMFLTFSQRLNFLIRCGAKIFRCGAKNIWHKNVSATPIWKSSAQPWCNVNVYYYLFFTTF